MSEVTETEQELIATAQQAMSSCNWTVGECAEKWCRRYSRGRTDVDFGALVNLSGDQVYTRRRVWEEFGVSGTLRKLKWSHFQVSLAWSDRDECLDWAEEQGATVAEMKAWRRMQNGEDLTVEAEEDNSGLGESVIPKRAATIASFEDELTSIEKPERDPRETATTTSAVAPAYSTARSDEAKRQREPDANQIDEAKRAKRCLARAHTAYRELAKISGGKFIDLGRDDSDQVAEDFRQGEEPNGLDPATIDAVIRGIYAA